MTTQFRRLSRLSIAGIAACAALVPAGVALAQFFSPGPLARAHRGLEGLERCSKCHQEQKGLSAKLCLDCHTELAARVSKGQGLHGRMPATDRDACQNCHPDHRGLDFPIVEWEGGRDKLDHRRTGWPLEGAHAKARCDDCHEKQLIVDGSVRRMLDKQPKATTYLGLSERCESCHFDEHRGQVGRDCAKCHDQKAWKPEPGFDHQKTAYPLLGKHAQVTCAKCHPTATDDNFAANARPRPRAPTYVTMKPIEHKSCQSCHEDPHKGELGAACASCHSEVGWKIIKTDRGKDTGFHDKTRYPLRGGHIGVPCQSCHGPFPGQPAKFKGLAFGACTDCHQDAHFGQIKPTPPAKAPACDRCHTVNGFVPVRFELEQHATTHFPLEGAHASVACRECHPLDGRLATQSSAGAHKPPAHRARRALFSLAVLRPAKSPLDCAGCHEDVHRAQFSREEKPTECSTCHKTTSFSDLKFDHDKQSRFPLTGKHAQTACGGCHKPEKPRAGAAFVRYRPLASACGGCHTDVHQGQFLSAGRDCDFCHETKDFKHTLFDHNQRRFTSFALEGKHAAVKCSGCHPEVHVTESISTVRYRPLPRACEDCHVDFHHGAFRGFEP
jgi:hypothetical protein